MQNVSFLTLLMACVALQVCQSTGQLLDIDDTLMNLNSIDVLGKTSPVRRSPRGLIGGVLDSVLGSNLDYRQPSYYGTLAAPSAMTARKCTSNDDCKKIGSSVCHTYANGESDCYWQVVLDGGSPCEKNAHCQQGTICRNVAGGKYCMLPFV